MAKKQSAAKQKNAAFETEITHSRSISCDGGKGPLGHPKVFFTIANNATEVTCPYCSKLFIYEPKK